MCAPENAIYMQAGLGQLFNVDHVSLLSDYTVNQSHGACFVRHSQNM